MIRPCREEDNMAFHFYFIISVLCESRRAGSHYHTYGIIY